MSVTRTFKLNTGAEIPTVGFGTFEPSSTVDTAEAVKVALEKGYRHIDTASLYRTEGAVGKAIKESGIPRSEIFVTTKVWITQFRDVRGAFEQSLKELGLDYVDLYLIHWPFAMIPDPKVDDYEAYLGVDREVNINDVWAELQKLPKSQVKAIGVSNFTVNKLKQLLEAKTTNVVPAVNQIELHPLLPQKKLIDFMHEKGIIPQAYTPLAKGNVALPVISKIAKKHNVDPAQISLSWNVQRGVVVLPKSATPSRIESNYKLVKLSDEEVKEIDELGKNYERLIAGPCPELDVFEGDADC